MLQIPKNVMQIGESNPYCKIYMEDYVHTFLERRKDQEIYLAFGKKEEIDGVLYYMIYGAEKKTDWDRGSIPYFKKYERLGTLEGTPERRQFRPVRGDALPLDGYFVFYEQNEDMQAYMIMVREKEEAGREAEQEQVLEAVRARREMRRESEPPKKEEGNRGNSERGRAQMPRFALPKRSRNSVLARPRRERGRERQIWTVPELCRVASLVLLLVLVVTGLTSVNRYPDMQAVGRMFGDALEQLRGNAEGDQEQVNALEEDTGLVVEDLQLSAGAEQAETEGTAAPGSIEWTVGRQESAPETEQGTESVRKEETDPDSEEAVPEETVSEETAAQALARPESYVVKKGDNLAEICRRFYGDTSRLQEICAVNRIENPDQIQPGQNILLP